jgi:hypothetical protein
MPANRVRKFLRLDDLQFFLNGAIVGGTFNKSQGGGSPAPLGIGLNGLVGLTLVFTSPVSATVTFGLTNITYGGHYGSADPASTPPGTNPDPYTLIFKDLKMQIEAAVTGVVVLTDADQHIVIVESTPASGVALSHTGTANAILGFSTTVDETGLVYKPASVSPAPPCWVWAYSGNDNMHNVYTWE